MKQTITGAACKAPQVASVPPWRSLVASAQALLLDLWEIDRRYSLQLELGEFPAPTNTDEPPAEGVEAVLAWFRTAASCVLQSVTDVGSSESGRMVAARADDTAEKLLRYADSLAPAERRPFLESAADLVEALACALPKKDRPPYRERLAELRSRIEHGEVPPSGEA